MNTAKCYGVSRRHTPLKVLGMTAVVFLVLVGIGGATQDKIISTV